MSQPGSRPGETARRALGAIQELQRRIAQLEGERHEPIAVLGCGCRLPGADGPEALWELLRRGGDAIGDAPPDRWDPSLAGEGLPPPRGGFLRGIDAFDAAFFGISPREAERMDPQQRLFLEVAWEALEDAGIPPTSLRGSRTAVAVGVHNQSSDFWAMQYGDPASIDTYTGTGSAHAVISGRLAYLLDLRGPCVSVDTACSSSLVAVHLACGWLRARQCDLAVVGGVNLALAPQFSLAMGKMQMLSPDGRCKTFDASANGIVRGEGCGVVVLKRLADAAAAPDAIRAVIRGSAVNQDGASNGLTAPNGAAQRDLLRAALQDARVEPPDLGYVETHGTGTRLGDPIEVEAIREVLGAPRPDGRPLWLGAVKANLGHLEGASGIAGLIKVLLAIEHRAIPPQIHLAVENPQLGLEGSRLRIPRAVVPWEGRRVAGLSSFGWSGTNAHLVIEEPPPAPDGPREAAPDGPLVLPLSARSAGALAALAGRHRPLIEAGDDAAASAICRAAAARRSHHPYRAALVGDGAAGLARALGAPLDRAPRAGSGEGLALVFSGQGSEWAGAGRGLLALAPFREAIGRCDAALRGPLGWSVLEALERGADLSRTEVVQPLVFSIQVGLAEQLAAYGLRPEAVLGHSLGEVAAAHVSGALPLDGAARLLAARGRWMQAGAGRGAMIAAAMSPGDAAREVERWGGRIAVAAVNGPASVVLAGERDVVEALVESLGDKGVRVRTVQARYAFHSPLMDEAARGVAEAIAGLRAGPARIPFFSTVTGRQVKGEALDPGYWSDNVRQPVQFLPAVREALRAGHRVFVEVGPNADLCPHLLRIFEAERAPGAAIPTLRRGGPERRSLAESVARLYEAGVDLDWGAIAGPPPRRTPALPRYPWQRERHWPERLSWRPAAGGPPREIDHPLLTRRVRAPRPLFEAEIGQGAPPGLRDHQVNGQAVVPAAAFVELALAAWRRAGGALPCELEEVSFDRPLRLPDGGEPPAVVQVQLDRGRFEVHAQEGAEAEWRLHAAGQVRACAGGPAPRPPPAGGLDGAMAAEEVYAELRAQGLEYGPSFQLVRELRRGERSAAARVALPEGGEADRWTAHPALLDACLQPAAACLPAAGGGRAWVPTRIGRLVVHAPLPARALVEVRVHEAGPEAASADVLVRGEEGEARIELADLQLRLARLAPRARPGAAYELAWRAAGPPAPDPSPAGAPWVVLADRGGIAERLARALEARGQRCAVAAEPPRTPARVVSLLAADAAAEDAAAACERALALIQGAAAGTRLWLVTRGADRAPAQAAVLALAATAARERPELGCARVDLGPEPGAADLEALVAELLSASPEPAVAIRDGERRVARLAPAPPPLAPELYRLEAGAPGRLESLGLVAAARRAPGPGEVELEVLATGLNFRDVLSALDLYPGAAGALGMECAARVLRAGPGAPFAEGDEVVAFARDAFARVLTADARLVARRPAGWSPEQAAGLPAAFLTAYHALHGVAEVRAGERVLVHAAAGGVGMAAVQLALAAGAEVYVTAHPSKWPAAKAPGVVLAMSSRGPEFADQLRQATGGEGVDVVINSLGGELIARGLELLRPGGRFVELGKRDAWDAEAVRERYPHVRHTRIDLAEIAASDPERIRTLLAELVARAEAGRIRPLPTRLWPLAGAVDAFRQMAAGRHTGKCVLVHPALSRRPGAGEAFLITGGLGGLGLRTAAALAARGARHLWLLSRSGPGPEQEEAVRRLEAAGARVRARAADAASEAALAAVLAEIDREGLGLAGIFHAAGVLEDGVLSAQTPERLRRALAGKAAGAWNLHRLTEDRPVRHFVLFSSIAATLGSAGQGPYAAANGFLDALARLRRDRGLAALSVSFGPWAGGGMASRLDGRGAERWRAMGVGALDPDAALASLLALLDGPSPHAVVADVDWSRFPREPLTGELSSGAAAARPAQVDLGAEVGGAPEHERRERLGHHVAARAASLLRTTASAIDPGRPLAELGMDSLMSVELRNLLAADVGRDLPQDLLFNHSSVAALAGHLHQLLFQHPAPAPATALEQMSERELAAALEAQLATHHGGRS